MDAITQLSVTATPGARYAFPEPPSSSNRAQYEEDDWIDDELDLQRRLLSHDEKLRLRRRIRREDDEIMELILTMLPFLK